MWCYIVVQCTESDNWTRKPYLRNLHLLWCTSPRMGPGHCTSFVDPPISTVECYNAKFHCMSLQNCFVGEFTPHHHVSWTFPIRSAHFSMTGFPDGQSKWPFYLRIHRARFLYTRCLVVVVYILSSPLRLRKSRQWSCFLYSKRFCQGVSNRRLWTRGNNLMFSSMQKQNLTKNSSWW